MKNDPVVRALADLDDIPLHTPEGYRAFAAALGSKSNLVIAKAARILGTAHWLDFTGDLAVVFGRVMKRSAADDKGCAAKIAIARALIQFEYDGAELFLSGMKHVQREPVWGGSEDSAADLRSVCAMGLAGSTYYFKLREFVTLLADREWQARAGAVRALAAVGSETASLLLRFKLLTGDKEIDVMSECFSGLIAVDGAEALSVIALFARGKESDVKEAAILALGSCRRVDAVELLKEMFGSTIDPDEKRWIITALGVARNETSRGFLEHLMEEANDKTKQLAREALSPLN